MVSGLYFWLSLVQLAKMWGSLFWKRLVSGFYVRLAGRANKCTGVGVTGLHHMQNSEKHYCVCRLTGLFTCLHISAHVYECLCAYTRLCIYRCSLTTI